MANELILEDNEINFVLVRDMLRFKDYRTIETQTAEERIRVAREKKPALILRDFHLPKMNGIEAFKALRADAATSWAFERLPELSSGFETKMFTNSMRA